MTRIAGGSRGASHNACAVWHSWWSGAGSGYVGSRGVRVARRIVHPFFLALMTLMLVVHATARAKAQPDDDWVGKRVVAKTGDLTLLLFSP